MKMQGPYWVYTHTTPDGMVYVGMSSRKETRLRWKPSHYKTTSLQPFIEEFGWENIEHFFIDGIQTRESALKLENDLIELYREMGCCINKQGSGGWTLNKEKIKEYREDHKEYQKEYQRQYREKHKEEIRQYQKLYKQRKNHLI